MFTSTVDRQSFVNAAIRIIIFRRRFVAGNVPSLFLVQPTRRKKKKVRKLETVASFHFYFYSRQRRAVNRSDSPHTECTTDSKFRVDGAAVTIDARVVDTKRGLAASTSISDLGDSG